MRYTNPRLLYLLYNRRSPAAYYPHYFPPAISVEAFAHLKSVHSTPAVHLPSDRSNRASGVEAFAHFFRLRQDRNDFAHCSASVSGSRVDAKYLFLLRHHLVTDGNWLPFGTAPPP